MTPTFGHRLRLQREERGVALAAIAADTKIKMSLLEALERDDVSQWPSGIFRRAYLRSYAQAIGLDPEPVVKEFLELYPDPAEAALQAENDAEAVPPPSSNRLRRLVTSAIAAVPALHQGNRRSVPPPPTPAAPREYVIQTDRHDIEQPTIAPSAPGHMDAGPPDVGLGPAAHEPGPHAEEEFVLVPPLAYADDDPGPLPRREPGLADAAELCTRLGRAVDRRDLDPILEDAARLLDAVGLVVWSWDARATALRPSLAHGYSDLVLARLPVVRAEADNAIAAAFRSAEPCVVNGDREVTGAAVFPLMGPSRCVGVLALELRNGGEQREAVRALATILAAQLVTLLGSEPIAEAASA